MSIAARSLLRYRCYHARAIFLRLCEKPYCTIGMKNRRIISPHKRFSEKLKLFLPCHGYTSIGVNTSPQNNFPETNDTLSEHKVLHSLLRNSIHYKNTILPPIKNIARVTPAVIEKLYAVDWTKENAQSILNAFKTLAYCHLSGSHFDAWLYRNIFEAAVSKISKLGDSQLMILMQCLVAMNDIIEDSDVVHEKFMKALSTVCLERFFNSGTEVLLLMCDAFYQLKDYRSAYFWRAVRKLATRPYKLTGKNLVQLMFLLNLAKIKSVVNMFEIEYRLEECISELTGNEIGIIARGFFLCKRGIKSKTLIPVIIDKVANHAHTMDSTALASAMKLIRYSDCVHCLPKFRNLLKCLHSEIPRLSLKSLTHVTHAFGGLRVYDETLVRSILERAKSEVKDARLKDIERIIYGIAAVTPSTSYYSDACRVLADEVLTTYKTERAAEINKYPRSLIRIVTFLSFKNIYLRELLELVLTPTFIQKIYNNNLKLLTNEFLSIHCSVKIDFPSYDGPLLNDFLYQYLVKTYSTNDDIRRKDNSLKLRSEIVYLCQHKLGLKLYVDYILPHYANREIVFGTDEHNNPVDAEPILSEMPAGTIKFVNSDELKKITWKVLFILPMVTKILGHDGYSGAAHRYFRQLKTVGYTPIPICEYKWNTLHSEEQKESYLRQLINEQVYTEL